VQAKNELAERKALTLDCDLQTALCPHRVYKIPQTQRPTSPFFGSCRKPRPANLSRAETENIVIPSSLILE